jgi:hypothetical protein
VMASMPRSGNALLGMLPYIEQHRHQLHRSEEPPLERATQFAVVLTFGWVMHSTSQRQADRGFCNSDLRHDLPAGFGTKSGERGSQDQDTVDLSLANKVSHSQLRR